MNRITCTRYTPEILVSDINKLVDSYGFIECGSAGKSLLRRDIPYLRIGSGPRKVFFNGAHHGMEWMTSMVLTEFAFRLAEAFAKGHSICGYNAGEVLEKASIMIMPMVNPDGVDIAINGISPQHPYFDELLSMNRGSREFGQVWQANARGVDLNHNYPAKWYMSKMLEAENGIAGPGPTRYSGLHPLSEPESQCVYNFTLKYDFDLVAAFHSQGEVIYWDYERSATKQARTIAEILSRISGYALDETSGIASYAGYKDWFISEFRRPGYTIEIGMGRNPLPISQFDIIYPPNEKIMLFCSMLR